MSEKAEKKIKLEFSINEIKNLKWACGQAVKGYNKDIEEIQKSRKISKKDREELIRDILRDSSEFSRLEKFFYKVLGL